MIVIDSNSLIVLILGLINPKLINKHKKTSIYEEKDFYNLLNIIGELSNLIILPNIWTEVDNLLNRLSGSYKYAYVSTLVEVLKVSSKKYIASSLGVKRDYFQQIGLTDSLILELAKECKFIITSDSQLSDFAMANGIAVYDMIKIRNEDFK